MRPIPACAGALTAALALMVSWCAAPSALAVGWERVEAGPGTSGYAIALDPEHDQLVCFGGWRPDFTYTSDVWVRPCPGGSWTRLTPAGTPPSLRSGARMIFDAPSHRMLVYGGSPPYSGFLNSVGAEVYGLTLDGTPMWSVVVPAADGPAFPTGSSLVLDNRRHRLLAFGGGGVVRFGGMLVDDTYEATLDGTPRWTGALAPASKPPGRFGHSAWYDSTSDRMIVHAGAGIFVSLHDTWQLDLTGATPGWTQVPATVPWPQNSGLAWVDEPARRAFLLPDATQLWSLRLDISPPAWVTTALAGPRPPTVAGAAWDAPRHRLHALAGSGYGEPAGWALRIGDGPDTTWTVESAPAYVPPTPRGGTPFVYDAVRDRYLVLAGGDASATLTADCQAVDGATLRSWQALGAGPSPRRGACAALDRANDRVLLFGGRDASGDVGDLWQLSLASGAWTALAPTGDGPPPARAYATLVSDEAGRRMLLYGGAQAPAGATTNGLADCWALALDGPPRWSALPPAPRALYNHTAAWDSVAQRMLVLGGVDWPVSAPTAVAGHWLDALSFPGGTPGWTEIPTTGLGVNLNAHAAVLDIRRRRLIALGGDPLSGVGSVDPNLLEWQLDLGTMAWDTLAAIGPPPRQRLGAMAAYDAPRDRIVLFGGYEPSQSFGDTWLLPFDDPTPVLASRVSAGWNDGAIEIRWRVSETGGEYALERRAANASWLPLANLRPDGLGDLGYADRDVEPGGTYGYRLRASGGAGSAVLDEVTVTAPLTGFALRPAFASAGALRVHFVLPDRAPATLELFDVAGRRLASRLMPSPEPGAHVESFAAPLPPGVYLVRLGCARGTLHSRAVVLR